MLAVACQLVQLVDGATRTDDPDVAVLLGISRQVLLEELFGLGSHLAAQHSQSTRVVGIAFGETNAMDDTREITETLLAGRTVILNLEGMDLEIAQRIIDFTSGSAFAIDGNLQKISSYIFLVTPANVDISGDMQDLLNTSFDVPIQNRY